MAGILAARDLMKVEHAPGESPVKDILETFHIQNGNPPMAGLTGISIDLPRKAPEGAGK